MKRYLYSLCFIVALTGLSACSKNNDPAPAAPVVGRWELNRGLLSGFTAPYTSINGVGLDLYNNGLFDSYSSRIDVLSDKSFVDNIKSGGSVGDGFGTWEYTNSQLTLTYDGGGQYVYTYSSAKGIEELTSTALEKISLPVSSTASSSTLASGNLQVVYRK